MKIAIYALCYNEEIMLPFFMEHYSTIADRIVIYDNQSTDNSVEIAYDMGATEVRIFDTSDQIRDDITLVLRNNHWHELKDCGYDWIFVVDIDEFIYHMDLMNYLEQAKNDNYSIIVPQGYQMIGDENLSAVKYPPQHIQLGCKSYEYSKPVIFNPDKIVHTNFTPGAHYCKPTGEISIKSTNDIGLLHYHWLSLDWVLSRNEWRKQRLSRINNKHGWGRQYNYSAIHTADTYHGYRKVCYNVIDELTDSGFEETKNYTKVITQANGFYRRP
jgi:hypothetical protein